MAIAEQSFGPSEAPFVARSFDPHPATAERDLDRTLIRLREHAREFARAPLTDKIAWLEQLGARLADVAPDMVFAACRAKGLDPASAIAGEEWLAGPAVTLRNLRLLGESLRQIRENGVPHIEQSALSARDGGGAVVRVIPHDGYDRALFGGFSCETWLDRSLEPERVPENQASFYQERDRDGGVSLVLGAGNVASIPPMDVLYKMFVEGHVCVLKMNPVNEYLGPFFERAFAALIDKGYLAIVYGGAQVGSYLCHHPAVDDVHITGSDKTHDLIVWGPPGPERDDRKRRNDPLLAKPISSELGNVSPVMVVPGPYSDAELGVMAQNIAGMITNNASFNCNAAKLLVLPSGWGDADTLLGHLEAALERVPLRKAYYPGARQRWKQLTESATELITIGDTSEDTLPWTIVTGVDASRDEPQLTVEPFCSLLSVTEVASTDPVDFLRRATDFANDKVWGTLNAMLFVHPRHESDPTVRPALDRAITDLRYGTVALNHWPAMVYAFGVPPWGGHPSATLEDIQSGLGWVHNTLMLERVEKNVLRGPLRAFPKPAWFPGHKTLDQLGRRLVAFERSPSWLKLPQLAITALRG
jgi:acyl-CoA reductase-like NAD-dependent aldehyde dehydrogenase